MQPAPAAYITDEPADPTYVPMTRRVIAQRPEDVLGAQRLRGPRDSAQGSARTEGRDQKIFPPLTRDVEGRYFLYWVKAPHPWRCLVRDLLRGMDDRARA